jgi:hypothetical protein
MSFWTDPVSKHYMKAFLIIILFNLVAYISSAQTEEIKIDRIRIHFQTKKASLPEMYEIKFINRTVDFIKPNTKLPVEKEIKETRKFSKKEWREILILIDSTSFATFDSFATAEVDGPKYSLNIFYSNGESKRLEISEVNAPDTLKELHRMLKNKK